MADRRTITSLAPIDLRATLTYHTAGLRDPSMRLLRDEAWVATRLASGAATLHIVGQRQQFEAEAWGAGSDEALHRAPGLIGAEDDPSGFAPADTVLRRLLKRFPGIRITRSGAVVEMLLRTVIGQKVTGKEAKASYRRLVTDVSEPAPGPGELLMPPDPAVLAGLGYPAFHPYGIERKRATTLIRVAEHAGRLQEAAEMPLPDAYARIRAVPGVGPWTAGLVGMAALGDPDAVPVGDYNIPNSVAWLLAGEPRADDERMLELLEPYRGHRARVIQLVKTSGSRPPRFGPRRPIRRFERW
jgi:3-methyladenine DNA glycosylase/8-oxoguanine DNA glycosylase